VNREPPTVVAFTKDWDDVPTCTTHVLREMGKAMPVLWIESIGTRKPNLAAARDAGRAVRKVRRALAGGVAKENRLRVLSPLVIPRTGARFGRWLNRRLIGWQIRRELARLWVDARPHAGESTDNGPLATDRQIEYWCFVPNAVDLLPRFRVQGSEFTVHASRPLVVYYCVDDWSKFPNVDHEWMARKEEELLRVADVVFTPARYLVEKCRAVAGDRVFHVPHGVEYERFARALDPRTRVPEDLAAAPKPVVGFYGNIYPWIDFDLVETLARRRPRWTFALIGGVFCDVSRFDGLNNVRLLGRREHDVLPAYCRGFDAAMIPYDLRDPRMESVNPVKTRELLAAGVPVVASDVPELRGFGGDVRIARSPDEWCAALEEQIARRDRREISRRVAADDWSARVEEIRKIIGIRISDFAGAFNPQDPL
jgi:glycosyltransferase involved in cell wall biosynthesis